MKSPKTRNVQILSTNHSPHPGGSVSFASPLRSVRSPFRYAQCSDFSVIIPTKNRPADLHATLRSLFRQTLLPVEILVMDQSPDDESERQVEIQFSEAPHAVRERIQLRYFRDPRISGLAAARNRAMGLACGTIWLFLDDDVELEPDFLDQLARAYQRHPNATGISGMITNYQLPDIGSRTWTRIFARGAFYDDRQPVYWHAHGFRTAGPQRVTRLGGGLMSFSADAIRDLAFDESLTGVCDGEDVDFCMQLGAEAVLLIAPAARLAHNQSGVGRARDHWVRRFVQANTYLYHRHWRKGFANRLCFLWLNIGLAVASTLASLRRVSIEPFRALLEGSRTGSQLARSKPGSQCPPH
jgi:GT2 family glycosyltransferase